MGWGSPFQDAWNAASDAAKAAAQQVASKAGELYDAGKQAAGDAIDRGKQALDAAKERAAQALDEAKQRAQEAVEAAQQRAEQAVEEAKERAQQAVQEARERAEQAVGAAKEKAEQALAAAKEKAEQAIEATKAKAAEVYEAAQARARDALRGVADLGYDGGTGAVDAGKQALADAKAAYAKMKSLFGTQPAGSPIQHCPATAGTTGDGAKDPDRDGWLMVPQGPKKPCLAIPPGPAALAAARAQSVVSDSACCQARLAGAAPKDILYVNGIDTQAGAHCETLNQIAQQTCGRLVGIYNATEGFAADALQTGQDRLLIKAAEAGKAIPTMDGRNPAVDTLAKTISQELRDGRSPEIWAHSQGGAVTSLAMFQALQERAVATAEANPLAGMVVKSFGAAAPYWPDGPAYEHFVHVNDLTPSLFGLGHAAADDIANAGLGARVIRFAGDPNSALPFTKPDLNWIPAKDSNHGVAKTYLKMEKQLNGGCP